jgi:hypothetical protein
MVHFAGDVVIRRVRQSVRQTGKNALSLMDARFDPDLAAPLAARG